MKTVQGSIRGVDEHLRPTGSDERVPLGEVHADRCVRYLLGLPRLVTPEGAACCPPTLRLEGRQEMWMEFVRRDPSARFLLSMKNGEQGLPVDEMQAVQRARLFIEHYGEETHHTLEIRLPPELRARIRERDEAVDAERRRRLASAPPRATFSQRASLLRLFRKYTIAVDRAAGVLSETRRGADRELLRLEQVERADVEGLGGAGRTCRVVVGLEGTGEDRPVGRARWTEAEAVAIAEAVNDAIDLPEQKRRLLRYRRAREESGATP